MLISHHQKTLEVRPKKYLGQHFLKDENIASKIVNGLSLDGYDTVLEVGPGMGVLTKYLIGKPVELFVAEVDQESVLYLQEHYPSLQGHILSDFLKLDLKFQFGKPIAVIGNFPYNISSQILFQIIDHFEQIPEMVGMFQKEVAERVAAVPRTKDYGILSVLIQALYDVEYLFTVNENVFNPPPKVKSGVIRLTRNPKSGAVENFEELRKIVKTGFNQRRKTLRNSWKSLGIPDRLQNHEFLTKRAEELSVEDFIKITELWKSSN